MTHLSSQVALTMGDPAGVGPELIVKLLSGRWAGARPRVIGSAGVLRREAAKLGSQIEIRTLGAGRAPGADPNVIYVHDVAGELDEALVPGQVDAACGQAAFDYVCEAIDLANQGHVAAIVTAPINKAAWAAAGIHHPGHTELLAERAGAPEVAMMLVNQELRVVLVTIHCALAEALQRVTFEAESAAIDLAYRGARACGIAAPRVAVAGLNPHAGEAGRFGREEIEVIAPAIQAARDRGIDATGPWPGDTVFMQARAGQFDIVVAQYHDQGLIPVKYLGVDDGVNVTLGLPFVRTSPDHGTAFDIAGKGLARPDSLEAALGLAHTLVAAGAP